MKKKNGRKGKRKRGIAPAAVVLAGAVCCWTGLVKVDRQIRAVTINQSPPLWETREEGNILRVTLLGHEAELDLGPAREVGQAVGAEVAQILQTPAAPERVWWAVREIAG